MAESVGEIPNGEREFQESTRRIRDIVEFPEITEEEFESLLKKASRAYGGPLPHRTMSICPETRRVVRALVWEKDGKVWITKRCPEGMITDLYYEDVDLYYRFSKWRWEEKELYSTNVENSGVNCPLDCGMCSRHRSHTSLLNIVLTNRCNLACWYCFFYAKEGQPIYEPTLEQIRQMLRNAKKEYPIGANAVQLTGGEPTLRDDLIEIIRMAHEEGYDHVQLNTDGIKLAFDPELVKKIREAGTNTLYMSYDGMTPQTNWKNHWEVPLIFENVRKAGGPGIVLVPTTIRNVNDHELGAIINFGLNHLDIVRGVNFQPISQVGRVPRKERQRFRITIAGAIKRIEEQTNGVIEKNDWYPIPIAGHIARFFEAFTGSKYYMTSHFACGAATYVFLDREHKRVVPINRFLDVEGFVSYLEEKAEEIEQWKTLGKLKKLKLGAEIFMKFRSFYDDKYAPKGLKVLDLIKNAFMHGNYDALGQFHTNALFLGMMHFMDEYNYDVERVERCVIHYAMPDGRIVPFCTFNVIPELYRDKVQAQYSYTWEEWKALHPDWDYKKDKYFRTKEFVEKMKNSEVYRKTYIDIEDYFGTIKAKA
ncbi:tetraether lipid synthase Tes [Thermococcus sp.]|uniref:tetraether lipid synthase Tes n=1 Tax=Thermococcus sp. TaxID=35749 RepID=UPI0026080102|nr:radical SAM protein [Thermococcus sp.]